MDVMEVNYLMSLSASGVVTYTDDMAHVCQVMEWLDTPRGQVYGLPSWGNELKNFKHEPTNSTATAVNIEFSIVTGIARDLPEIVLTSIFCEPHPIESDRFLITIGLPTTEIRKEL